MDEPLEFTTRTTRIDFLAHFIRHNLLDSWIVWLLPLGFSAVYAFLILPRESWLQALVTFLIWFGCMFAAIVVLVILIIGIKVMRFDRDGLILEEKRVKVDGSGIETTGSNSRGHFEWSRVARLKVTGRFVLLVLAGKPEMHVLLPRRCLPDGGVEQLQEMFELYHSAN